MVYKFGQGALMAKFDAESAYRNLAIHPRDRSMYYVDLALPFGLRSAPYISNSVADLVEWILLSNYHIPDLLHYLDDYITATHLTLLNVNKILNCFLSLCSTWFAASLIKEGGPTTCMHDYPWH